MAYYTGTAANLAALKTALLTHAQADGWTLTGDVLSKAGVYFQITDNATHVMCLGCADNAVSTPAPNVASIGRIFVRSGYPTREITFPATYHVFGFAQELYFVVNYDVVYHQWMAFGKSTVPGLSGHGGWFGATIGEPRANNGTAPTEPIYLTGNAGSLGHASLSSILTCAALFSQGNVVNYGDAFAYQRNAYVMHGLDGHGWGWGASSTRGPIAQAHLQPLLDIQPSTWNGDSILLPLRAWKERPSFKTSLVADLENARLVRNDLFSDGQVITVGSDSWMVFPWYRKDIANRAGSSSSSGANHTGTFGWAIRYEGP